MFESISGPRLSACEHIGGYQQHFTIDIAIPFARFKLYNSAYLKLSRDRNPTVAEVKHRRKMAIVRLSGLPQVGHLRPSPGPTMFAATPGPERRARTRKPMHRNTGWAGCQIQGPGWRTQHRDPHLRRGQASDI